MPVLSASHNGRMPPGRGREREMAVDHKAGLPPLGCFSGAPPGVTAVPVDARTVSAERTQLWRMDLSSSRDHLSGGKLVPTTAAPPLPMTDIANRLGGILTESFTQSLPVYWSPQQLTAVGHSGSRFKRECLSDANCEAETGDQGKYTCLLFGRNMRKYRLFSC